MLLQTPKLPLHQESRQKQPLMPSLYHAARREPCESVPACLQSTGQKPQKNHGEKHHVTPAAQSWQVIQVLKE